MSKKSEGGYAMVFVLMLAAALFILVAMAMRGMYSAHSQNRQEKQQILRQAEKLNQQVPNNSGK